MTRSLRRRIPVLAALILVLYASRFALVPLIVSGANPWVLVSLLNGASLLAFAVLGLAFGPTYERAAPLSGRAATILVLLAAPMFAASALADTVVGPGQPLLAAIDVLPSFSLGLGLSLGCWVAGQHGLVPRPIAIAGQYGGAGLVVTAIGVTVGGLWGRQLQSLGLYLTTLLLYYLAGLARLGTSEPWASRWSGRATT